MHDSAGYLPSLEPLISTWSYDLWEQHQDSVVPLFPRVAQKREVSTIGPQYPRILHPQIPNTDSTRPFYVRDLSIHGFWYLKVSWNQCPAIPEGQLWNELQLPPLELVSRPCWCHSQLPSHSAFIYGGPSEQNDAFVHTFIHETSSPLVTMLFLGHGYCVCPLLLKIEQGA